MGRQNGQQALYDPVRSSGGLHEAGRLRRGVAEFLRLPLLLTLLFSLAGVAVAVLDATAGRHAPLRGVAAAMVPGGGAVEFVSAVATSVVTITSITFSVLLLAVQQTASSLTAVVFDQFLRRVTNQLYFGFFVGLSAYSFIVLGAARDDPPPVYGAALTLVLTIAGLVVLLLLIHGTIDQMRPQSVVRSIHELALRARERELRLLGRTRAERHTDPDTRHRPVTVPDSGYVVSIDLDRLAAVTRDAGPGAEVIVDAPLGDYVIFGEPVAQIAGVAADDDRYDDDVRRAFGLDDIRDVEAESGYATDQLENISWSSSSSSQQSPQTAVTAIRALHDLAARWLEAGERDRSDRTEGEEELPVVYPDGVVPRVLDSLAAAVVATAESRQVKTCAAALRAFIGIARRLRTDGDRRAFVEALDSVLPAVIQHAELPALRDALAELEEVLAAHRHEAGRVREVRELLAEATRRLLPKASDEPEAAHPRDGQNALR